MINDQDSQDPLAVVVILAAFFIAAWIIGRREGWGKAGRRRVAGCALIAAGNIGVYWCLFHLAPEESSARAALYRMVCITLFAMIWLQAFELLRRPSESNRRWWFLQWTKVQSLGRFFRSHMEESVVLAGLLLEITVILMVLRDANKDTIGPLAVALLFIFAWCIRGMSRRLALWSAGGIAVLGMISWLSPSRTGAVTTIVMMLGAAVFCFVYGFAFIDRPKDTPWSSPQESLK